MVLITIAFTFIGLNLQLGFLSTIKTDKALILTVSGLQPGNSVISTPFQNGRGSGGENYKRNIFLIFADTMYKGTHAGFTG